MPALKLKNSEALALAEHLARLQACLRPGRLWFLIGRLLSAASPVAEAVDKQRQALIDDCCEHDGDGEKPSRRLVTKTVNGQEQETVVWKDITGEEFTARHKELMDTVTEIHVPALLSMADIEALDKNRLDNITTSVDSTALYPVINFADEQGKPKAQSV